MKNTVIFDLDGTLLYTIEDICDSVNDALTKFNLPNITVDECVKMVGKGGRVLMESIAILYPSFLSLSKSSSSPSYNLVFKFWLAS